MSHKMSELRLWQDKMPLSLHGGRIFERNRSTDRPWASKAMVLWQRSTRGGTTSTGPTPVMIDRLGRNPLRTT